MAWRHMVRSGDKTFPISKVMPVDPNSAKVDIPRLLLVIGMNLIPRPLAIGMRFIPMDGACLPHWDEALDESTGIIEAVYFAI